MLSIGKLGRGQERYYLDKVAEGAEDYYSGEAEAEGYWLGHAAEDLGLQGKVEPAQLVGMLTGNDPATGEPLGLRHVQGGAVPGFDLTFSAPKSVSLTWALGGHPVAAEVKAAHADAVRAGLHYLQSVACWTRRGAGGHEFVQGNGFLAAGYVHRSSRAGDPQLHTHVLVANATQGPDGHWTRLYHPAIYEHAKTASYVYEAHLRDELTRRLGVRWREVVNGLSEIEGFTSEQLRAFSTRRAEILEAAGGESASARAMQIATLTTRQTKDRDLTTESLREVWRQKAEEVGLDRETIRATFGKERQAPEGQVAVATVEAELTAHASHFDRRDAIQAVANSLPAGAPGAEVVELADAYLATPGVIRIAESPRADRYTTRAIWDLEQKALASAEAMASASDRAVVDEVIVARVLAKRPSMKPDQEAMVRRLLGGGEGLVIVVGEAGTKGRKRFRGTARDRSAGRHLKGPWSASLAAAHSWRIDALARIEAGTLSAAAGPTVEEAAAVFIESIGSGAFRQRNGHSYKPSVVREYQRVLDKEVVPEFRRKQLARLQRPELQRWADSLTVDRSPSTVRNIVASLRALIAFPELRGWVHVNPSDGLRLPTGERQRDRIASAAEAAELIGALRSTDRAALGCAVYAGLRLGELLALDVAAVDLEGGWLHVHRSWDRGAKEFVSVKNRKPRKVPIIEKLAGLLEDHFVLLDHPAEGLLFPSANRLDWPIDPGILRRRIHKRWKDAGLAPLGFHEARHTYASIAIAAGLNPKTLSTYMGHSTITITFDRYGHLMPGSEDSARALLDSYLG